MGEIPRFYMYVTSNLYTVESTYKSPAYKSHSGYKSRCPFDGICPFFVCIRKKAVQVASIPQNSVYKSQLGFCLSVFTVKKRSKWLQLTTIM